MGDDAREAWLEERFVEFLVGRDARPKLTIAAFLQTTEREFPATAESWLRQLESRLEGHARSESAWPRLPRDEVEATADFEILERLGDGGMGSVFRARQKSVAREVALKVPRTQLQITEQQRERMLREARVVGNLRHPGIVTLYQVTEVAGTPHLVMELVDGVTLHELARSLSEDRDVLARALHRDCGPIEAAVEIAWQLGEALAYAHTHGVVHRDLKPQNVMIDRSGRVRVLDFGLASLDGAPALTQSTDLLGTPQFLPPEAHTIPPEFGPWTDVYAVGVILYQLLSARYPFGDGSLEHILARIRAGDAPSVRSVQPDVPHDLSAIVEKAMAVSPLHRYLSARGLVEDLERSRNGRPVSARPAGLARRLARKMRRQPVAWGASTLTFLLIATLAAFVWKRASERETERAAWVTRAHSDTRRYIEAERWREARDLLAEAEDRIGDATSSARSTHTRLAANLELMQRLAELRSRIAITARSTKSNGYVELFDSLGIDVVANTEEKLAEHIGAHPHSDLLVDALDHCAAALTFGGDDELARKLSRIAQVLDRGEARRSVRRAILAGDASELRRIAASPDVLDLEQPALRLLARALEHCGAIEHAARLIRSIPLRYPSSFDAHYDLAAFVVRNQRTNELRTAAQAITAALVLRPNRGEAYVNLARIYVQIGEASLAHHAATRARAIAPDQFEPHRLSACALFLLGQVDAARDVARNALRLARTREQRARAHTDLGRFSYDDDPAAARAEMQRALDLEPNNVEAAYSLARLAYDAKQYDRSRKLFERVVALDENHVDACYSLAEMDRRAGDVVSALPRVQRVLATNAEDRGDPALAYLWGAHIALRAAGAAEEDAVRRRRLQAGTAWFSRSIDMLERACAASPDRHDAILAEWKRALKTLPAPRESRRRSRFSRLPERVAAELGLAWLRFRELEEARKSR